MKTKEEQLQIFRYHLARFKQLGAEQGIDAVYNCAAGVAALAELIGGPVEVDTLENFLNNIDEVMEDLG